jgi:hypothetical protein
MKTTYPAAGCISIWIGSFKTEDEFDAVVEGSLVPDLGLECHIAEIVEMTHEEEPIAIRELLAGFSGDSTFIDAAVLDANRLGVETATSALVAYHLDVSDVQDSNLEGLFFLGSYSGSDVSSESEKAQQDKNR